MPGPGSGGPQAGTPTTASRQAARSLFGEQLPQALAYANLLAGDGVSHGLIGPREAGRLWERHLLPAAALATLVPRGARLCDVGSGAGLPGLAMALARPDLRVTLAEPLARRSAFLDRAVETTAMSGSVRVRRIRAEQLAAEGPGFDVVVARAVARLPLLLDWLIPLCRSGGQVLAVKGEAVAAEVQESAGILAGPLVALWDLVELPAPVLVEGEPDVVRVVRLVTAANVIPPRLRSGPGRSRAARRPAGRRTGRP